MYLQLYLHHLRPVSILAISKLGIQLLLLDKIHLTVLFYKTHRHVIRQSHSRVLLHCLVCIIDIFGSVLLLFVF